MNKLSKILIVYSVLISLVAVGFGIRQINLNSNISGLEEGNGVLQNNNEQLEEYLNDAQERIEELEKENNKLREKLSNLQNNKDNENLVKSLEKEIGDLNKRIEELEKEKQEVIQIYNQEILDIVDMLNMNPSIFEYDERGLINPRYALNVLELNKMKSDEYIDLEIRLYELTGIHDPLEAVEYLINKLNLSE